LIGKEKKNSFPLRIGGVYVGPLGPLCHMVQANDDSHDGPQLSKNEACKGELIESVSLVLEPYGVLQPPGMKHLATKILN
jgi:hypothetical protein